MSQRIRIKLKSYDHNLVDKSAEKIVKTVKTTGAVFRCQLTSEFLQLTALRMLTKKLANNFNCHHMQDCLTFTAVLQKQLML